MLASTLLLAWSLQAAPTPVPAQSPTQTPAHTKPATGTRTATAPGGSHNTSSTPQQPSAQAGVQNPGRGLPPSIEYSGNSWSVLPSLAAAPPATTLSGLTPGYHYLALYVPSTDIYELFILYVPAASQVADVPLLAAFHGFGVSPLDIRHNTTFDDECEQRGWYLFAPFSLVPVGQVANHFSSVPGQDATYSAFSWVMEHMAVDDERVYAVGHSMGAGMAASFAARHRSGPQIIYPGGQLVPSFWVPGGPTIAALALQTGTFDIADVYNSNTQTQGQLQALYGGTPAAFQFEYQRCSTVQVDPATNQPIVGGEHSLINLASVPTQVWYATNDPETYLVEQTQAFASELDNQPGAEVTVIPVVSNLHSWDTMDETLVCDWLKLQTLQFPTTGQYFADRPARYGYFDITPDTAGELATMDFDVQASNARIELTNLNNVAVIETSVEEWPGFPNFGALELEVNSNSGRVQVVLRGRNISPLIVFRDGLMVPAGQGWTFSFLTLELTVDENETGSHVWTFI